MGAVGSTFAGGIGGIIGLFLFFLLLAGLVALAGWLVHTLDKFLIRAREGVWQQLYRIIWGKTP